MLHLELADIAHEYAPYHRMTPFWHGAHGRKVEYSGVAAQAYDRGLECAMRVARHNEWIESNVGLN